MIGVEVVQGLLVLRFLLLSAGIQVCHASALLIESLLEVVDGFGMLAGLIIEVLLVRVAHGGQALIMLLMQCLNLTVVLLTLFAQGTVSVGLVLFGAQVVILDEAMLIAQFLFKLMEASLMALLQGSQVLFTPSVMIGEVLTVGDLQLANPLLDTRLQLIADLLLLGIDQLDLVM